jgi:hypothetical protein
LISFKKFEIRQSLCVVLKREVFRLALQGAFCKNNKQELANKRWLGKATEEPLMQFGGSMRDEAGLSKLGNGCHVHSPRVHHFSSLHRKLGAAGCTPIA